MIRIFLAVVLAGAMLAGNQPNAKAASAPMVSACDPLDDYASSQLGFLRRVAGAPGGADSAYRVRIKLPYLTDTSQIYAVSDSATCAAAVGPHNDYADYSPSELANAAAQRVYLIGVGQQWVASNPNVRSGDGYVGQFVMDSTYNLLSTFLR